MRNFFIFFILISLVPSLSNAQRWKRQRVEYSFGVGAANFLGDLGGADKIGTNGFEDFELSTTRYALQAGYRYRILRDLYVKGGLTYAEVRGSDYLTEEPARRMRELTFESHLVELGAQLEYMLIRQKSGHLYRLRGVRGKSWFRFEVYLFGGIGGLWYNPTAKAPDGDWFSLRDMHTEGQGLPGGPEQYSGLTFVLPYGIGIRRSLGGAGSRRFSPWSITLELSMRKTFSDYIDDVSDVYYDNDKIRANYGNDAAYFADPSGNFSGLVDDGDGNLIGQQRGDKDDNDAYMLGIIAINYKIQKRRRNLPKF